MKNITVRFALGSTVNDGLLCKDGTGNYKVSTEFESGDRYYGDIKLFDTKQEAQDFIEANEMWALQVVEYAPTMYYVTLDSNKFEFDSAYEAELFACNNEVPTFTDSDGFSHDVNL